MEASPVSKTGKPFTLATGLVDARRMFICLACFQIEAWQAVVACTLTCWKTNPEAPTLVAVLFLAGGMMLANPPWHAIAFEAAHRLTTPVGSQSLLAGAGIAIAVLSIFKASIASAVIGGVGAVITLYPKSVPMGGALIAVSWALAVHDNVTYVRWVAPTMLCADYPESELLLKTAFTRTKQKIQDVSKSTFDK